MSKQPIPEHADCVFQGVMFDVYQWDQVMYDGSTARFEKLKRPDTVVVFPVLPDGRILLTEQEQPGKRPFVGAAGGRVDPGEEVLDAAKRELLEETGYAADTLLLWDAVQPASKIEWAVYTFIAKDVHKVTEMALDAGEKISLRPTTFDDFLHVATSGSFAEVEVVPKVYEALLDSEKMRALRALFKPNKS